VCWGDNREGQCNVPADLGPAVQVAAGERHTAALLADGRTRVWGHSCDGVPWEIGDEQVVDFLISSGHSLSKSYGDQLLARLPSGSVKHTPAGHSKHTAALLADGRVVCWGTNIDRQCSVPADLGPAVQVAAGGSHTAALLADGRVVCWGYNSHGQCSVPADLGPAVQVAAGGYHTVALLADGRVVCWGRSDEGQCNVPASIQGRAAAIHADASSTWAVDVDGRLHGWGEIKKVDSLPFELTDDSWLEFATRTWGQIKQKIYPEHIRKSAAFKAIRTMHKLAEG
jgi:alpha-tubulin suppressor-like RCC1 family protein